MIKEFHHGIRILPYFLSMAASTCLRLIFLLLLMPNLHPIYPISSPSPSPVSQWCHHWWTGFSMDARTPSPWGWGSWADSSRSILWSDFGLCISWLTNGHLFEPSPSCLSNRWKVGDIVFVWVRSLLLRLKYLREGILTRGSDSMHSMRLLPRFNWMRQGKWMPEISFTIL